MLLKIHPAFGPPTRRYAQDAASKIKPLHIPGLFKKEQTEQTKQRSFLLPNYNNFGANHDWTAVWPAASSFSQSRVPLPLRQGFVKNRAENGGVVPSKYANAELMKIPNFLHLTPSHIDKHCAALKELCTRWPTGLKTEEDMRKYYPLEVITKSYFNSTPSVRDRRANAVTLQFHFDYLPIERSAKQKLLRLCIGPGAGRNFCQFDWKSRVMQLTSSRCPTSTQNYDFLIYAFTVSVLESRKVENWELAKTHEDAEQFEWNLSPQRENLAKALECDPAKLDDSEEVLAYRSALNTIYADNAIDVNDPWYVRPEPYREKKRHRKSGQILDPPFQIIHGTADPSKLSVYKNAVKKLFNVVQ